MSAIYENTAILEVQSLCVRRGTRTLISDLNFTLSPGDMLWIKGGNGIGKTSLLQCCAGLLRPETGRILWNGLPIDKTAGFAAYQGHVDAHKGELTAIENLEFWHDVYDSPADINGALKRVGLWLQRNLRTKSLSAGQSRRLALARMLISNTPLWVLDEPAAAMDIKGQDLIQELLREHITRKGSILLASHGAPNRIGTHTRLLVLHEGNDAEL